MRKTNTKVVSFDVHVIYLTDVSLHFHLSQYYAWYLCLSWILLILIITVAPRNLLLSGFYWFCSFKNTVLEPFSRNTRTRLYCQSIFTNMFLKTIVFRVHFNIIFRALLKLLFTLWHNVINFAKLKRVTQKHILYYIIFRFINLIKFACYRIPTVYSLWVRLCINDSMLFFYSILLVFQILIRQHCKLPTNRLKIIFLSADSPPRVGETKNVFECLSVLS